MFERISRKDVVAFNQQFDHGTIINEGSLTFSLEQANASKSWLRSCAYLVRAVLIDHVFEEGNKRTAASIIGAFLEEHGYEFLPEELARAVAQILMKNYTSITKIERVIKNVII